MAFAGYLVLALAVMLGIAAPRALPRAPIEDPVKARLVAESSSIAPGETLWVALHLDIATGLARLLAQSRRCRIAAARSPGNCRPVLPPARSPGRARALCRR